MKLHALQNAASFTRRKRLIQRSRRVSIEVILHQSNVLCVRINLINQPTNHLGVVVHGALLGHLDMPLARQWFNHHKQVTCAFAFILIIHALRLACLNRNRKVGISMQHNWFLIQANRW